MINQELKTIERQARFEEWKQDVKQRKIVKALATGFPDYVPSPEEQMEAAHTKKFIGSLVEFIKGKISEEDYSLLYNFFVMHIKVTKLAEELKVNKSTISRRIKKLCRDIANLIENEYEDTDDLFTSKDNVPSVFGSVAPMMPYEYEMNRIGTKYRYRGKDRWHTKCKIPEYLKDSFGSKCRCPLCFDDYGCNNCTRRKHN